MVMVVALVMVVVVVVVMVVVMVMMIIIIMMMVVVKVIDAKINNISTKLATYIQVRDPMSQLISYLA